VHDTIMIVEMTDTV